ncbi:MAG: MFS transporter [Alicyclobacillus sp.]|nr:MFS transporter [Alicyclobacillus sp.]
MSQAPQTSTSMFALLRNQFVRTILLSGFFLQIGIWVRNFGVLLFVMQKTHGNAFAISMISVAEFLPIFLFSFIGGTFADRWRAKRTMVWCDLLSGLSIGAVLLVLHTGEWHVTFFATLVSSILSQFSQPSGMRLFKVHVPDALMQAGMSLYQTLFAVFVILGPVIGTFVYQRFGIFVAIGVTGVGFLLSAGTLTFLPPDPPPSHDKASTTVLMEMMLGVQYVLKRKTLTLLGGSFLAAGLALGLTQPLGIFIVTERLHLPAGDLQWLMAVFGIAMILGGFLSMLGSKRIPPQRLLMLGMLVNALVMLLVSFSTHLWLTLVAQFFAGLVLPGLQTGINTMILQNTEEAYVGRVMGSLNPLFMGGMVLTMSLAGWLKQVTSLLAMYIGSSILFLIGLAVILPLYHLPAPSKRSDLPDAVPQS